jgi:hypothetical protein
MFDEAEIKCDTKTTLKNNRASLPSQWSILEKLNIKKKAHAVCSLDIECFYLPSVTCAAVVDKIVNCAAQQTSAYETNYRFANA